MVLAWTHNVRTVVLKRRINEDKMIDTVEKKKAALFRSLLSTPKKEEIHIQYLGLHYEGALVVAGKYTADYFRKATHTISVGSNVHEVIMGGNVFAVRPKSRLKKTLMRKMWKNKVDMKLEEHVFVEEEDRLAFEYHGRKTKFPYSIDSKTVERNPDKILSGNQANVKGLRFTYDEKVAALQAKLKKPIKQRVRNLREEFTVSEVTEAYIPIYEARLAGPGRKTRTMRVDAHRNKIL